MVQALLPPEPRTRKPVEMQQGVKRSVTLTCQHSKVDEQGRVGPLSVAQQAFPHLKWKLGRWRSAGEIFLSRFSEVSFLLITSVYVSHKCGTFSFAVIYFSVFFKRHCLQILYMATMHFEYRHTHSLLSQSSTTLLSQQHNSIRSFQIPESIQCCQCVDERRGIQWNMNALSGPCPKETDPLSSYSCLLLVPLLGEGFASTYSSGPWILLNSALIFRHAKTCSLSFCYFCFLCGQRTHSMYSVYLNFLSLALWFRV